MTDTAWSAAGHVGIHVAETDSTNTDVRALAVDGAPHGTWLVADRQTAGRGRLGRTWELPIGAGLALSVLLRPRLPPAQVPLLCLAAAEVVAGLHPDLKIKWPNDVLLPGGRKVAGILAEAELDASGAMAVVLGVGVNLSASPPLPTAGHLSELGVVLARREVAEHIVAGVLAWCTRLEAEGSGPLVDAWTARCGMVGAQVRVSGVAGVAQGIDGSGTLWILDDGVAKPIRAGDVEIVRWADEA